MVTCIILGIIIIIIIILIIIFVYIIVCGTFLRGGALGRAALGMLQGIPHITLLFHLSHHLTNILHKRKTKHLTAATANMFVLVVGRAIKETLTTGGDVHLCSTDQLPGITLDGASSKRGLRRMTQHTNRRQLNDTLTVWDKLHDGLKRLTLVIAI